MERGSRKFKNAVNSRYWNQADAAVVVDAWRESGESLTGFARRWSVSARRLGRWAARLEKETTASTAVAVRFHPVQVVEPMPRADTSARVVAQAQWLAELQREQWSVRVPVGFEESEMARLLGLVAEVEQC